MEYIGWLKLLYITSQFLSLIMFPAVLVFVEILVYLASDMYLPALPKIASEFRVSQDTALYTQTAWFLGSMSVQLLLGPVVDRYGRKAILTIGIILFIIANFCCAYTANINIFIFARFIQGMTVGAVFVSGYATIHDMYSGKEAVQILAIMASVTILAPALGPVVGAYIITYGKWQYVFGMLGVAGILAFAGTLWAMPADKPIAATYHSNQNSGQNLSGLFTRVVKDYKAIFSNYNFMILTIILCCSIICFFIWIVESPFIIITTHGKSEIYLGVVQLFVFSGFIVGAQTGKKLIKTWQPKSICDLGLAIVGTSVVLFMLLAYLDVNIQFIILFMITFGFGHATMSGLLNRMAIEASDKSMAQRVAVLSMMISLAGSLGSYLVTFINNMTFENISYLMLGFISLAMILYSKARSSEIIKIKE